MTIPSDHTLSTISQVNDTQYRVEYFKNDSMYVTNFARIAPFILARGRERIASMMKPYLRSIVRAHTDGFISKVKLDVKTGTQMGDLKYDGYCSKCIIQNNIKVDGAFV